ncbi:hypothetical protein [Paractinoplanes rishiriensis]|uniref:Uncharacterized protein n=1 Tax=Paractinoplanes rishiriensis TaxID=1050105 RepID=A0A919MYK6_9ACTN|nr:hypothetical protein [Actinoplanes rishiriensis]GIF00030.1 hypothetical protein Ari01nite_74940 [Actinoplanes rishiriensis]
METQGSRLGVDIGRVIIGGGGPGGGDTQFFSGDTARMLATPAVPGAFAALARLVPRFEQVWLVSKCGERVQRHTRQWLDHHDFAGRTGIPRDNIRFCLRRPDKALHCADLGITHFIDDKLDVHQALRDVVPHRYLFGPQRSRPPAWVQHTETWAAVEAAIARSLGPAVVRHVVG